MTVTVLADATGAPARHGRSTLELVTEVAYEMQAMPTARGGSQEYLGILTNGSNEKAEECDTLCQPPTVQAASASGLRARSRLAAWTASS